MKAKKMSKIRKAFKIHKRNGIIYPDIIKAFLDSIIITVSDFDKGFIYPSDNLPYRLFCSKEVKQAIGIDGYCLCKVSFQRRTTGLFAVAVKKRTPETFTE